MESKPTTSRHSASFVTFQKPCEEALSDLSEAYNRLADQWEEMHAALSQISRWPAAGVAQELARKTLSGL